MKKMQIIQLKKMIIKILIIKLQLFLKEVKKKLELMINIENNFHFK